MAAYTYAALMRFMPSADNGHRSRSCVRSGNMALRAIAKLVQKGMRRQRADPRAREVLEDGTQTTSTYGLYNRSLFFWGLGPGGHRCGVLPVCRSNQDDGGSQRNGGSTSNQEGAG